MDLVDSVETTLLVSNRGHRLPPEPGHPRARPPRRGVREICDYLARSSWLQPGQGCAVSPLPALVDAGQTAGMSGNCVVARHCRYVLPNEAPGGAVLPLHRTGQQTTARYQTGPDPFLAAPRLSLGQDNETTARGVIDADSFGKEFALFWRPILLNDGTGFVNRVLHLVRRASPDASELERQPFVLPLRACLVRPLR